MSLAMPPLLAPMNAPDGATAVELAGCTANDFSDSRLTPVTDVVALVAGLKDDPTDKIFVSAIAGPSTPYGVQWSPAGAANPQDPNELWPSVMLSCGASGDPALNPATMDLSADGTRGEPAVRLAHFAQSFLHGLDASICDPSYAGVMTQIAQGLSTVTRGLKCTGGNVRLGPQSQPDCTVVATYLEPPNTPVQEALPLCVGHPQAPCWRATDDGTVCPDQGHAIEIIPDPSFQNAAGLVYDVSCTVCDSSKGIPGCP